MNISPEFKRNLKRSFRNEELAKKVYKGSTEEVREALEAISQQTGININFLNNNLTELRKLAFNI